MKSNLKLRFFIFLALISFQFLTAQNPNIRIVGKVIEANTKVPVEYPTISILDNNSQSPITGIITTEDGIFELKTDASNFYIEVSFIGFKTKIFKSLKIENKKIDLKTIILEEDNEALDEALIRAEKSQTEFKLDKRVFNVGQDLSFTGAGVLEVLNNVPSVSVSIEGEVSLRGTLDCGHTQAKLNL